jgi:hypothetical protein
MKFVGDFFNFLCTNFTNYTVSDISQNVVRTFYTIFFVGYLGVFSWPNFTK